MFNAIEKSIYRNGIKAIKKNGDLILASKKISKLMKYILERSKERKKRRDDA